MVNFSCIFFIEVSFFENYKHFAVVTDCHDTIIEKYINILLSISLKIYLTVYRLFYFNLSKIVIKIA